MENTISEGYVTEKILNAFLAGSIPIYYGDKLAKEIFNPDSFVNITDFESIEHCAEYVSSLSTEKINQMRSGSFLKSQEAISYFDKSSAIYSSIRNDIKKMIINE